MSDLDRVMAAITKEPGISNAGLSEELGIAPDTLKELTMQLRAQRQAAFRSLPDEDGDIIVGWYPAPYEPQPRKAPEESTPEPASKPQPALATNLCPECGHTAKNAAGLFMHLSKKHGIKSEKKEAANKRRRKAANPKPAKASSTRVHDYPMRAPKDDGRPRAKCPVDDCKFRPLINRPSIEGHLRNVHTMELRDRSLRVSAWMEEHAAEQLVESPAADPAVDADIIPPSEIECEGCDQLHDGECAQGEECVCNCATKMEQLEAELPDCGDACRIGPLPPAEEFISDVRGAIDKCGGSLPWWDSYPGPRVLRFPDRAEYEEYLTRPPLPWGDLTVEQAYLDAFERKVRDDLPEPTALEQMCAMAREIEEIARRRGFKCGVHLTCGDGITADGLFVSIKPEAGA